jgi:hypothetical protein
MSAKVRGSARTLANIMAVSSVMLPSPISCMTAQTGECKRQAHADKHNVLGSPPRLTKNDNSPAAVFVLQPPDSKFPAGRELKIQGDID